MAEEVTQAALKQLFDYDPETGKFVVKANREGSYRKKGDEVGSRNKKGYYTVWFKGRNHYLHRLIWLFVYGSWPEIVDHINRDKADNRLINLKSVDYSESNRNRSSWKWAHG